MRPGHRGRASKLWIAVAIALGLVGGCGGDDTSGAAGTSAEAISDDGVPASDIALAEIGDAFGAQLRERSASTPVEMTEAEGSCVGRAFFGAVVDEVGHEALDAADVSADSLEGLGTLITNEQFDLFFLDSLVACTDFIDKLVRDVGPTAGWTEESATCLFEVLLADPDSRQAIATGIFTFGNLSPIAPGISAEAGTGALFGCFPDDELAFVLANASLTEVDASEASLECFYLFLLDDSDRREALQKVLVDGTSGGMLAAISADPTLGPVARDAVSRCFSNNEKLRLGTDY